MIRWVNLIRTLCRRHLARLAWLIPSLILLASCTLALRITAWRAPEFPSAIASLAADSATGSKDAQVAEIPPAALAATLWDELFPPPPSPPPPEPPPRLDLELIAIVVPATSEGSDGDQGADVARRAVVFRKDRSEIAELQVGQSLPGRPEITLASLTNRAATFTVGDHKVTLELQP